MALNNVIPYTKPHSNGNGEGGTVIYLGNNNNYSTQNLNVKSITSALGNINDLTVRDIHGQNANFEYIESSQIDVGKIAGSDLDFITGQINDLKSQSINTNKLKAEDTIDTNQLVANNIVAHDIVTDTLTVNKSAHFFELIIDKMRSVNGTFINTAANCKIDYVRGYTSTGQVTSPTANNVAYWRCYWRKEDDGQAIENKWKQYDQAICQSFNAQEGTTYNTSNKYYWRHVLRTDNGSTSYINFATNQITNNPPTDYTITFSTLPKYGGEYIDDEQQTVQEWNTNTLITGNGWDNTNQWTVDDNQQTLHITMPDKLSFNGGLYFITSTLTKINVGIYYQDGSYEYKPAESTKTEYYIETAESKYVVEFVLTSEIVGKWEACNWIDLSRTDCDPDSNGIPEIGDEIAQLGYRYDLGDSLDKKRSSAIIMAAYQTPDTGVIPPSYAQYTGIGEDANNRWELSGKRKTYFDATGGHIVGDFTVQVDNNTTVPLNQYIQSYNNANPLEGFISTNSNQPIDLIVMQPDNNHKITDLNNFPANLQVMVNYEGSPQMSINDYDVLNLTLFDVTYDLLDANNYTINLPSGYEGIYVRNITKGQYGPFNLVLDFTGSEQTITTDSMILYTEITVSGTTYQLTKNIPINSVTTVEGTNGIFDELNTIKRTSEVDGNQDLTVELIYNIKHVDGTTVTFPAAGNNQYINVTTYYSNGNSNIEPEYWQSSQQYFRFTDSMSNYYSTTNPKPLYYKVDLMYGNDIVDTDIVNIQLTPLSLFSVTDGMTTSFQGQVNGINHNISLINQTMTGISATVDAQTATLDTMTGQISSINNNIADLAIQATGISARVTSVSTNLNTLEENLQSSGIDIYANKIILSSENTDIQGNLNIHNANEGLIIYDNATDTPKIAIVGDTLGAYTDSFSAPIPIYTDKYVTGNTCTFDRIPVGNLQTQNTINVDNINIWVLEPTSAISSMTYEISVKKDATQKYAKTGSLVYDNNMGAWTVNPELTFNIQEAGQYYLDITVTSNSSQNNVIFRLTGNSWVNLNTLNKIAMDGAVFASDQDKFAWFGSDGIKLQWNKNNLTFYDNGSNANAILYHPNSDNNGGSQGYSSYWRGELGSTMKHRNISIGNEAMLTEFEGFVTLTSGIQEKKYYWDIDDPSHWEQCFPLIIPRPTDICPGKYYFIKNKTNKDVILIPYGTGSNSAHKYLINAGDRTPTDWKHIENDALLVFNDGEYWNILW